MGRGRASVATKVGSTNGAQVLVAKIICVFASALKSPEGAKDCSPRRKPRVGDKKRSSPGRAKEREYSSCEKSSFAPPGLKNVTHPSPRLTPWANSFRSSGASDPLCYPVFQLRHKHFVLISIKRTCSGHLFERVQNQPY